MAKGKINLKVYCKLGKSKIDNCYCNYFNPQCEKGYKGECIVINKSYNPYSDINECQSNTSRTYKKVHGRVRQSR